MSTPNKYVALNSVEHPSPADRNGDDLSRQSLTNNKQPPINSRSGSPIDRAADGPIDEEEADMPLTFRRVMVLVAMAFLWTASQIPLYFYGGIEPQIIQSIGGYTTYVWIGLGNLIPLGVVTPFVGALSDLFGRKNIGMASFILIMLGNIVCATSQSMNTFIIGSVFMGVGAGLGELIALAVAGEIAPTKYRGIYIGGMIMTILPFCPAVLYAQFVAYASTWRWVGLIIGGWSLIGLLLTFAFYWPPPRHIGLTRSELLRRIDYVGGFLSAAGVTLFLVGLTLPTQQQSSGQNNSWRSAPVLATIVVGGCSLVVFAVWEWRFARYPMFPARLKEKNPRVLAILLLVTFVSGANFFAVLIFWPTQYQNVYAHNNAISQGIGSLPVGFGIILGSVICTGLITILKGKIRLLMVVSCIVMTAGNGAMAAASLTNLPVLWFIISLACLGVGAVIVPNQVIAGIVCPDDLLATITAATIAARILGGSIAYTIYYDVFTLRFDNLAKDYIGPAAYKVGITNIKQIEIIAGLLRSGAYEQLLVYPGTGVVNQTQVEVLTQAGKQTLVASYSLVYYVSIAFGGIATIASCFLTGIEAQMGSGIAVKLA